MKLSVKDASYEAMKHFKFVLEKMSKMVFNLHSLKYIYFRECKLKTILDIFSNKNV